MDAYLTNQALFIKIWPYNDIRQWYIIILENQPKVNLKIAFVDYKKIFDSVIRKMLKTIMNKTDYTAYAKKAIKNLYKDA